MLTRVLDCPKCGGRFEYECGSVIPDKIHCPLCKCDFPKADADVVLFCPSCRGKLAVPFDMVIEGQSISCPECGVSISLKESSLLADLRHDGSTIDVFSEEDDEPEQMLKDGEFFDKFQIIRLLGRGGMAEVYLAEHLLFKRQCALKIMTAMSANPVMTKRFIQEAKISHAIDDPHIVKVYDVGTDAKTNMLFIAMEYVEGESFAQYSKKVGPLPEKVLWQVLREVTQALIVLGEKNVVHRDLKPSNIMRQPDGSCKLMDLGIAKAESNRAQNELTLTMAQAVMGTPGYASPEQCQSSHEVDCRADIFSLGASIYHLASGKMPYEGESSIDIIMHTLKSNPEPLEKLRPELSPKLLKLVAQMMAREPGKRPENAKALMALIERREKWYEQPFMAIVGRVGRTILPFWKKEIHFGAAVVWLCIIAASGLFFTKEMLFPVKPFVEKTLPPVEPIYSSRAGKDFVVYKNRTIKFRLKEAQKRLQAFRKQNRPLVTAEVEKFCLRQIQELKMQQKYTLAQQKVKELSFDAPVNRKMRERMEAALTGVDHYQDLDLTPFRKELLGALKSGKLNPNLKFPFRNRKVALLQIAAENRVKKEQELVRALLEKDADVNLPFETPAIILSHPELFWHGMENIDSCAGDSPLMTAYSSSAVSGQNVARRLLLLSPEVNNPWGANNGNLIFTAARKNDKKLAVSLIGCGFRESGIRNENGLTPWQTALTKGSSDVCTLLKTFNLTSSHTPVQERQYLLFCAVEKGEFEEIPPLLSYGTPSGDTNWQGETILLTACRRKDAKLLKVLLENLVKPNPEPVAEEYPKEKLPLFIALNNDDLASFNLLVEYGANPSLPFFCKKAGKCCIFTLLGELSKEDPFAVIPYFEALFKKKWNPNSTDPQGRTALYCAAMCDPVNYDLVVYLRCKGSSNEISVNGTSLMDHFTAASPMAQALQTAPGGLPDRIEAQLRSFWKSKEKKPVVKRGPVKSKLELQCFKVFGSAASKDMMRFFKKIEAQCVPQENSGEKNCMKQLLHNFPAPFLRELDSLLKEVCTREPENRRLKDEMRSLEFVKLLVEEVSSYLDFQNLKTWSNFEKLAKAQQEYKKFITPYPDGISGWKTADGLSVLQGVPDELLLGLHGMRTLFPVPFAWDVEYCIENKLQPAGRSLKADGREFQRLIRLSATDRKMIWKMHPVLAGCSADSDFFFAQFHFPQEKVTPIPGAWHVFFNDAGGRSCKLSRDTKAITPSVFVQNSSGEWRREKALSSQYAYRCSIRWKQLPDNGGVLLIIGIPWNLLGHANIPDTGKFNVNFRWDWDGLRHPEQQLVWEQPEPAFAAGEGKISLGTVLF